MPFASTFVAWAESLETLSYYDILRVPPDASPDAVKAAFHHQSLRCHPDRYVDADPEVGQAAGEVFKKLAEAYNVLKSPELRKRYDAELAKGAVKMDVHAAPEKKVVARSCYTIARHPEAKHHAAVADELLAQGRVDEAKDALRLACEHDPKNEELAERLATM